MKHGPMPKCAHVVGIGNVIRVLRADHRCRKGTAFSGRSVQTAATIQELRIAARNLAAASRAEQR